MASVKVNLAIAAHGISRDSSLWTLNADDFADLPELILVH